MHLGVGKFILTLATMLWLVRSWNISQNYSSFRQTCRVLKLQLLHSIAKGITSSRSCRHVYHAVLQRPKLYFPCGSNAWQSQTSKFAAEALFYISFELFQLYKEMSTFSMTRSGNLKGKAEEPSSKLILYRERLLFKLRPPCSYLRWIAYL